MSRQHRLTALLSQHLEPVVLTIEDESAQHNVPKGAESHFKVTVVSAKFEQDSRIARHRRVNQWVQHEFSTDLHALSLHLYTPSEWAKKTNAVPDSPVCHGGSRPKSKP